MDFVLDITRLVSRAHLPFDTGIDRVERAFVLDSLDRFENPYFLAKTGTKYTVLDALGVRVFLDREALGDWEAPRGTDVFRRKLSKPQRAVRTTLRRLRKAQFPEKKVVNGFEQLGLRVFDYTNVGHTNLAPTFLAALKSAGCRKLSVFVHDLIPLDFPDLCRQDTIPRFIKNMQSVAAHADWVFVNSDYTLERTRHHFTRFGRVPKLYRGYLASPDPSSGTVPRSQQNAYANFVMLGTIEPRKNISFLLDVWDILALQFPPERMPRLSIVGKRGWESTVVLDRLDRAKANGTIQELPDLDDASVQEMLRNSDALLFPSLVEGYGLPAQEAISLGTPVIGSDIPVFQELFKNQALLLPNDKPGVWAQQIAAHVSGETNLATNHRNMRESDKPVTWNIFFDMLYKNFQNE